MRPKKNASMKDIAETVGVSVNTVSQALSNKSGVNSKTRDLILETAKNIGYEYTRIETSPLPGSKTRTVGLIITDSANPFFAHVVRGVQNTLWQNKHSLILCNTNEDYSRERGAVDMLLERGVDGIIMTPTQAHDQDISMLIATKVPIVLLGRHFANFSIPSVLHDDRSGAYKAVDHLFRLGHTKILFINAPRYISSSQERLDGYLSCFKENGLEPDPTLIRYCEPTMESAYNEMKSIQLEKLDFTAVFTFSDLMMLGVVRLAHEIGLRIPDDCSLVGFDDIDFVSLLTPPLTTVSLDKHALGVKSAGMIMSLIKGEPLLEDNLVLPTKLTIRNSTKKL